MFDNAVLPFELRRQQRAALHALERRWGSGATRAWVALPPGAGKTIVGLEAARRLRRRTVVFGPNTAIQQQWLSAAAGYRPEPIEAGTDRVLDEPLTVLTYQSLATFDPEHEIDEEGHEDTGASLVDRLHANGRELVENLCAAGPLTLVLDECHHLLEVWGRLLAELLDKVPDAHVIGLTATPPTTLSVDQAALVETLFGRPVFAASIPAVVRDGDLAPFVELAWLTAPTAGEARWLREQATRFAQLTSDLDHPDFATVPLWQWLDRRFAERTSSSGAPISWQRLEKDHPQLTAAALRFSHAGRLALPHGARLREEHRSAPTAEDWVQVIDDYVTGFLARSDHPIDAVAYDRLRAALPAVGWTLTRKGVRVGRSPVDRVLARSESKTRAAVEIAAAESASLGDQVRILVLTDHHHATATLPAALVGVLAREAGSATLVLEHLCADPVTAALDPVLVTGTTVACAPDTAARLLQFVSASTSKELTTKPGDAPGTVAIIGSWSPRTWVPLVTAFLTAGHSRLLVGTRALLGEGWDAPCVNVLIDLTTATTPTSVVQTRGRALRIDPASPAKVANNWSVTCITEEHPKGTADWSRLVRKHAGFLALDASGDISDGVTHLDPTFSPYAPPPAAQFDELNAAAMLRSALRDEVRAGWQVGTPYDDMLTSRVHIARARKPVGEGDELTAQAPSSVVPAERGAQRVPESGNPAERSRWSSPPATAVLTATAASTVGVAAATGGSMLAAATGVAVAACAGAGELAASARAGRLLDEARSEPDLAMFGNAVAEALVAVGLVSREKVVAAGGAGRTSSLVAVTVDTHGVYRVALRGADAAESETFAAALDEVLSPIGSPRYLMPRYVLAPRGRSRGSRSYAGWRWRRGYSPPNAVIFHSVPTVLAINAKRAHAFGSAWSRWVSAGVPVYANSPEGEGILATHRGRSPLDVTTALRVSWR